MVFGWKPDDIHGAPIPMHFDFETNELPINMQTQNEFPIYYIGKRYNDSLLMHRQFANKKKMLGPDEIPSYHFKFPPHQNVIDAIGDSQKKGSRSNVGGPTKQFSGMNPLLLENQIADALPFMKDQGIGTDRELLVKQMEELKETAGSLEETIILDSSFESGNLDMAI